MKKKFAIKDAFSESYLLTIGWYSGKNDPDLFVLFDSHDEAERYIINNPGVNFGRPVTIAELFVIEKE